MRTQTRISRIILLFTIAAGIFWIVGKSINVYSWPVVGAIFEILWLPSLIILFILPIISFVYWVNEKFNLKSFNLYSIILAVVAVLLIMLIK